MDSVHPFHDIACLSCAVSGVLGENALPPAHVATARHAILSQ
jgi:hypothetical protein